MTRPFLPHPKHWTTSTLESNPKGEVIISVSSGSTPSTSISEYWDGKIPWLTPKDVTNNYTEIYVLKTDRIISSLGLKNSGAKLMPPGTVMLTKRAPVGISVINAVPMATNQGFLNFRCGKLLDPVYFCLWLQCNRPYLDAVANGSTYSELYLADLFEFEISFPSIEEQKKISKFLLSIEASIRLGDILETATLEASATMNIRNETMDLIKFRNILLPKLFSGEISVEKLKIVNFH